MADESLVLILGPGWEEVKCSSSTSLSLTIFFFLWICGSSCVCVSDLKVR